MVAYFAPAIIPWLQCKSVGGAYRTLADQLRELGASRLHAAELKSQVNALEQEASRRK